MDYLMLDSKARAEGIGINFRPSKPGPEQALVENFLENLQIRVPKGCKLTLFREPKLDSGIPDLVAVIWHAATAERWNQNRFFLKSPDIRVMHYIAHSDCPTWETLQSLFGSRVKDSINRLEAAEMIEQQGDAFTAQSLSKLYATRHIIAVEAKITEWRGALEQAFRNLWFASSSYVLLPHIPRGSSVKAEATSLGIGVWCKEDIHWDLRCFHRKSTPISYASWLFNEWVWRASQQQQP